MRGRSTMHRLENSPERQTGNGIHFLISSFSAVSLVVSGFLNLFFFSPSAKSLLLLWLTHIWHSSDKRPDRGRERRFGTAAPSNEKWGSLSLRILAPAVFHIGCFAASAPTTKLPGVWGESKCKKGDGKEKGWFPQSLCFKSSFLFLKPELKEHSWVSLCLFHNAYFWILMLWNQAGDTWGEK